MSRPNENQKKRISIKSSIGTFVLEVTDRGLYSIRFPPRHAFREPGLDRGFQMLVRKLLGFEPDLRGFSPFQRKVYAVLRKVPAGKVITYGELARRAGYPGAARAVGSAMKKNRLPIVIPCHRVIPSSGGIGEYSGGKQWKRRLLKHEKHIHGGRSQVML